MPAVSKLTAVNNMIKIRTANSDPKIIYGLYRPHFDCVRSDIAPIIGSNNASTTLEVKNIVPAAAIETPAISVK